MSDICIETSCTESPITKPNQRLQLPGIIFIVSFAIAAAFLYYDRSNHISGFIHSFGASGIVGAILVMAIVCMTPVPSEGLLMMYFKIYGVSFGTLYAWCGYQLGSVAVYGFARFLGTKAICQWISPDRFDAIDDWISRKGTIGLFIVRLLPIPALVVNVITGLMPSVTLWKYSWTCGVAIIPYYIGVSLIFIGAIHQEITAFIIGIPVLMLIWFLGYWGRRRGRC